MDKRIIRISLALLPLLALQCSIEESEPPEATRLTLSPSPVKMFDFSWAEVAGAEFYQLLERADPDERFQRIGRDIVGDEVSIYVPLHLRAQASYILRACNAAGCTDSETLNVVGSLADAVGYFKASSSDEFDLFGGSVALSSDGNTLAVGASFEDGGTMGVDGNPNDNTALTAGAVYVFVRDPADGWSPQAYLKASNAYSGDRFGESLALSDDGNTLVVGAPNEDSDTNGIDGIQGDDSAIDAGAAYVFTRSAGQWSQQAYLKASNSGEGDHFGHAVVLGSNGNTLAIAAPWEDSDADGIDGDQSDDLATNAGAVYVFMRSPEAEWSQQAYLKASNSGEDDVFGWGMALSDDGNTLAVGAFREDSNAIGVGGTQTDDSAPNAGAAYVFMRSPEAEWSQQAYLKASNAGENDRFGASLALSGDGNTLAVGAYGEDSRANVIDGDHTDDDASNAGAAYLFVRDDAMEWAQRAYLKAPNATAGDGFGWSLALTDSGDMLAVGAHSEDGSGVGIDGDRTDDEAIDSGAVYVLVRDASGDWSHYAYVKASNTDMGDDFGHSVALSRRGDVLVVGAPWEDSGTTDIGGNQADDLMTAAGAVYVY